VFLLPHLVVCGYKQAKREYVSQMTFPSEIVCGVVENSR
jgi:hypothetical protein